MKIQELNQFVGKKIKDIRFVDESEKPSTYWFNVIVIDLGANHIKIRCSGLLPILWVERIHIGSEFHGMEFVNGVIEIFTSAGSIKVFVGQTVSVDSDEFLRDNVMYVVVKSENMALYAIMHHGDALIGERAMFEGQSPLIDAPTTLCVIAPDGSERTFGKPERQFGILTYELLHIGKAYRQSANEALAEAAAARA